MAKIEVDALNLAQRFINNHGYSAAELVLHEHLKANRDDLAAFAMLAEIYEKLSRFDLAVQNHRNAALIARAKGDEAAVARFDEAVKRIEGRHVATHEKRAPDDLLRKNEPVRSVVDKMGRKISPIFGYPEVANPGDANNYGYGIDIDYPYRPVEDEFIVGIFGGSIAVGLHRDGHTTLSQRLAAHPDVKGRRVTVLNFAMGGAKQPEAMLALSLFTAMGQKLDLVINVDGQNDILGYAKNLVVGQHMVMPLHELTDAFSALTAAIGLDAQSLEFFGRLSRLDHWIEKCDRSRVPGAALLSAHVKRNRKLLVANKPGVSSDVNLLHVQRTKPVSVFKLDDRDFDDLMDQFATFWFNCAGNMVRLCDGLGISYIHALHPTQHLMRRTLGPQDAAISATANLDIFARTIGRGFPKLVALGNTFHTLSDSAHYCDLQDILEGMGDGMLIDPWGHFNAFVYQAMAETLADFAANIRLR